jgi:hypothetical protein
MRKIKMMTESDAFVRMKGREFDLVPMERFEWEHPEQAYRRGVQQGAHFVFEALAADCSSVDPRFLAAVRHYVGVTLYRWRYNARRLRRQLHRDAPPRLKRPRDDRSVAVTPPRRSSMQD